jgi:hypothetical protein
MNTDISILNHLKEDFMKFADSNEQSTYEMNLSEIGGCLCGFDPADDPTIMLDNRHEGYWYVSINISVPYEIKWYPLEELPDEQIYEIRRIVETWLVKKDMGKLFS